MLVEFEDRGVVVVIADPTILCLATLESASLDIDGPKMKNSTALGFSVHVEDEDNEKYVGQLKLKHSKCCWTTASNVVSCLVRNFYLNAMYSFLLSSLKTDKSIC